MLSEEEAEKIKEQIIEQVKSWDASEEQKESAISQVKSMDSNQLEEFLEKNKMVNKSKEKQECPFCLIVQGKLQAYKIAENKESIAVLEINPLSKGHSIIIPKKHDSIEKIPKEAFSLAEKLAKLIKSKLKPKDISISTAKMFEHGIINIIPAYENEKQERKKASKEELEKLQKELTLVEKEKKPRVKKIKEKIILEHAPVRIP